MANSLDQQELEAPSAQDIAVRTMESDVQSLKQSGGLNPLPEASRARSYIKERETSEEPKTSTVNLPGYSGPEKGIFSQTGAVKELDAGKRRLKNLFLTVEIIAAIVLLLTLGYFIVLPNFLNR